MPLMESSALCGPKVLAHRLGITIPEAQSVSKWRVGKGTEPENMALAFRKFKWRAKVVINFSLDGIIEHKSKHGDNGVIILDYWDTLNGGADGHYVDFLRFDRFGNLFVWNPDFEALEGLTLPKSWFEGINHSWFDWRIDPPHEFLNKGAILAWR